MAIWRTGEKSISYDDLGSGQPVVLIHGHPFDRSMWRPQATFLAGRGFRVVAPDLRGYGQSDGPPGRRTLDVFARDIAGLLDELALPAAVVCGLSMGGQIALEFARLFPARVTALILAGTSAPAETAEGRRARNAMADRLLAEGMHGYADEVLAKMISPATIAASPQIAEHVRRMMYGTDPAAAAMALRGRAGRPDYTGLLSELTVPALVIVGADDEFTPVPDAELISRAIPGARLTVLEGAAHLPNLEKPAEFNAAVADFLAVSGRSLDSVLVHAGGSREQGAPTVHPPVLATILAGTGAPVAADYARGGNATWTALEQALGTIERADAVVFSSGQAASMALMLALARGRDKILLAHDGYYNARVLADMLRPHGAAPVPLDLQDLSAVERELGSGASLLWAESPTNPLLRVADLTALGRLAAAAGAPMIVDNTVATGLLQQPLDHGAVASLCSLTKSASGHSDVILGAVMTRDATLAAELRSWRATGGGIAGPMETWLAVRGLKTLPLRIERQSASALAIARQLAAHPRVRAVHYPGLDGPALATARAQMPRGFGPLLSFELDGTAADADAVVAAARLIVPATSFGGAESTWERRGRWPAETAPESLIRLSAGLEPAEDLIADLRTALAAPSR